MSLATLATTTPSCTSAPAFQNLAEMRAAALALAAAAAAASPASDQMIHLFEKTRLHTSVSFLISLLWNHSSALLDSSADYLCPRFGAFERAV